MYIMFLLQCSVQRVFWRCGYHWSWKHYSQSYCGVCWLPLFCVQSWMFRQGGRVVCPRDPITVSEMHCKMTMCVYVCVLMLPTPTTQDQSFLEQEALLTLLQSTQRFKCRPIGLDSAGEAVHPAVTSMGIWCKLGQQMPTVHVFAQQVRILLRLWVPTPSPVRHATASCGLLVLPQEDLPMPDRCPSAGHCDHLVAAKRLCFVYACARACVCSLVKGMLC